MAMPPHTTPNNTTNHNHEQQPMPTATQDHLATMTTQKMRMTTHK